MATIIPTSMSRSKALELFFSVTKYLIDKSRTLVKTKGIYRNPDPYCGYPIDENTVETALKYYLCDEFDCFRQSPNKSDVVTVVEDGIKKREVKRYLTRSIKEIYKVSRRENPELKMSLSEFYSLRPKWVIPQTYRDFCVCICCANFELAIIALNNQRNKRTTTGEVFQELFSIVEECADCHGIEGIHMASLELEKYQRVDVSYAVWENNDLITKTVQLQGFVAYIGVVTVSIVHREVKEIQSCSY